MRIEIPSLPPKACSPNARVHWAEKAKQAKRYRELSFLSAKSAMNGWIAPEKALVQLTFIIPDHRRRDIDNLVASFKSGLDGLVDAGVIRDDSGKRIVLDTPAIECIPGERKVLVTVEKFLTEKG
ncbi:MAG: endodeoxyribonuclease RusA [Dehalococcoidia bacterium]|nr:endodeoxyribonuclease RusA [Dehalococcoidia bacterium]